MFRTVKTDTDKETLQDDLTKLVKWYSNSNMDDFFMHENHAWPPSLARNCIMHHINKSDLMECLESLVPQPESALNSDVKVVDGAALVHTLDPKKSKVPVKTFQDYSQLVFLPCLECMLQDVGR